MMINLSLLIGSMLTITTNIYSMLSQWDHPPAEIEYTMERINYNNMRVPTIDNQNIRRVIYPNDKYYKGPYTSCFEKAIHQTTGVLGIAGFVPGNNKYTGIEIEKYFQQVSQPKNGNLVIYADDDRIMNHFGVVYNAQEMLIESQWGRHKECIIHEHHAVPFSYRNKVAFFDLKNEYKGAENKSALQEEINKDYIEFVARCMKNQKKAEMIVQESRDMSLEKTRQEENEFFRSLEQ